MSLKGQLEHRYEDYMESAARNKEFLNIRFKDVRAKNIVPLRDIGEKDEEVLFEAEFKDLLKDEKKQLEKEYMSIFNRYHQPSDKETKRLDEIVEEYIKIINEEFKNNEKVADRFELLIRPNERLKINCAIDRRRCL